MKKIMVLLAVAFMTASAGYAQSAIELAKQQRELNKVNMDMLNMKPSKDAKKQAKQRAKDGWEVPAGSLSMANQFTRAQLMRQELMANDAGEPVARYILHEATVTSGSESVGYSYARAQCQAEIASMLQTKIAAAIKRKQDNDQNSAIDATTVSKFHERGKSITEATLSMMTPVVHIYRVLPNNNYQVQVTIAYDKKVMKDQMKRQLAKELEAEGDELDKDLGDVVDEVLSEEFQ